MTRIIVLIVAALAVHTATPVLAQEPTAAQGAPRAVRAGNPFAAPIVEYAQALHRQYQAFYRFVAMYPWDAGGTMTRYAIYVRTYRLYWQAVAGYWQYEARERAFSGQVLATPRADESGTIDGAVPPAVMPAAAPLAGASVTLTEFSADGLAAGTGPGLSATTDRRGEFSIKGLQAGLRYEYHVQKAGYAAERGTFRFGQSSIRRRIVMSPEYRGRLAGRVLGLRPQYANEFLGDLRDGDTGDLERVAGGSEVAVDEARPVRTLRDFPLMIQTAGRYVIRSEKELKELTSDSFAPPDFSAIDFEREMILAAAMGPTAGMHEIEITGVRRADRRLVVTVRETRPAPDQPVPMIGQWPTHAVVVPREDIPVTFRNSGAPAPVDPRTVALSGATVQAFRAGPEVAICYGPDMTGPIDPDASIKASMIGDAIRTDRTDASGRFSIEGLPAGEYILQVSRAGYRDLYRRVSTTEDSLSLLMLPEGLITPPPVFKDAVAASADETETTAESLNNPFGSE